MNLQIEHVRIKGPAFNGSDISKPGLNLGMHFNSAKKTSYVFT